MERAEVTSILTGAALRAAANTLSNALDADILFFSGHIGWTSHAASFLKQHRRRERVVDERLTLAGEQRRMRDGLVAARQKEADALVELRAQHAALEGQRQRVEASTGPVRYWSPVRHHPARARTRRSASWRRP